MKFEITDNGLEKISSEGVIVFLFSNSHTKAFEKVNKDLDGSILEEVKSENFKAKTGEILTVRVCKKMLTPKIFIVGLGSFEEFETSTLRKAIAIFAKSNKNKVSSLALSLMGSSEVNLDSLTQAQMIVEGFLLGTYSFNKYKTEKKEKEKKLETAIISADRNLQPKIKEGIAIAEVYSKATSLARDLVNEPAALATPTFLSKVAQDIAKKDKNLFCTVYTKEEVEKMGMGAFLGVAQASDTPPKFIHLEYKPQGWPESKKKLAIVGKGITFDTGGVSLKPEQHMTTMKLDMAGAAAVLAVFSVISEIKPKFPVMGLIAATPNLVSGKALVPGDILKAMNGKTIEVLNTDAEGRVTLADSLSYAVHKRATHIIDLATLTGACAVALGDNIAGLFANNKDFREKVKNSAFLAGEKIWELPLEKEYKDLNKSDLADIANIPATRYGGAITAALFLQEFIDNKPWIHLDIAGPAFAEKKYDLGPKGGTGFGVRMLLNLLKTL